MLDNYREGIEEVDYTGGDRHYVKRCVWTLKGIVDVNGVLCSCAIGYDCRTQLAELAGMLKLRNPNDNASPLR
jgi:hypothetical protein